MGQFRLVTGEPRFIFAGERNGARQLDQALHVRPLCGGEGRLDPAAQLADGGGIIGLECMVEPLDLVALALKPAGRPLLQRQPERSILAGDGRQQPLAHQFMVDQAILLAVLYKGFPRQLAAQAVIVSGVDIAAAGQVAQQRLQQAAAPRQTAWNGGVLDQPQMGAERSALLGVCRGVGAGFQRGQVDIQHVAEALGMAGGERRIGGGQPGRRAHGDIGQQTQQQGDAGAQLQQPLLYGRGIAHSGQVAQCGVAVVGALAGGAVTAQEIG